MGAFLVVILVPVAVVVVGGVLLAALLWGAPLLVAGALGKGFGDGAFWVGAALAAGAYWRWHDYLWTEPKATTLSITLWVVIPLGLALVINGLATLRDRIRSRVRA